MKKDLKTAMAKNFQKMVNEQPAQEAPSKKSESTSVKKEEKKSVAAESKKAPVITPVMNEPEEVIPEPEPSSQIPVQVPVNVQPQPVAQPIQQPIIQPVIEPIMPMQTQSVPIQQPVQAPIQQPIQQAMPVYVQTPVNQNVMEAPILNQSVAPLASEPQISTKSSSKKSIPLVPEEKSSGVLHIRLGELRSYVDFMTQSSKMSYQQYISNLIEQDYEKNKDLYLKYKSFMDQLNM